MSKYDFIELPKGDYGVVRNGKVIAVGSELATAQIAWALNKAGPLPGGSKSAGQRLRLNEPPATQHSAEDFGGRLPVDRRRLMDAIEALEHGTGIAGLREGAVVRLRDIVEEGAAFAFAAGAQWGPQFAGLPEEHQPIAETPQGRQTTGGEAVVYIDKNGELVFPMGSQLGQMLKALPDVPVGKPLLPLYAHADTTPASADEVLVHRDLLASALGHIEHMAAWIGKQNAGYSFEGLGEDDVIAQLHVLVDPPAQRPEGK